MEGRLPDLDLGPEAVHPAYHGLSILNLPASLCRWFGAAELPHPPIDLAELDGLAQGVDQVVLCLVDALALHRFQQWVDGRASGLRPLVEHGILAPLTSVVPSTTTAALTTLWTGRSPAEHGMLGYELFLKGYGLIANMITHSPVAFEGRVGLLYQAGFDPESALPVPPLGPRLADAGVEVHAFLPQSIRGSGLSRMHYAGVRVYGYRSPSDLWLSVREVAERPFERRRLIWVYNGHVDTFSHLYGPDSVRVEAEFSSFVQAMLEDFVARLPSPVAGRTLLMLLADHGQITTRRDPHYELRNHPSLYRRLQLAPTGENRLAYLYSRPGQVQAVEEYVQRAWPGAFRLIPSSHALGAGLFGPGKPAQVASERIGDRVMISRGAAYLWWALKEDPLIGRHGGLSADEMLVPLLAARLG